MEFAHVVGDCPVFERLTLSAEDQRRGAMYQAQPSANNWNRASPHARFLPFPAAGGRNRAAGQGDAGARGATHQQDQPVQPDHAPLTPSSRSPIWSPPREWNCFTLRVQDRFGDNGVVGVAILRQQGTTSEIDTFLLSCRVIGRTVETAFLAFLADQCAREGRRPPAGLVPADEEKRAGAATFTPATASPPPTKNGDGTLWTLDLGEKPLAVPEWIRLHVLERRSIKDGCPSLRPGSQNRRRTCWTFPSPASVPIPPRNRRHLGLASTT